MAYSDAYDPNEGVAVIGLAGRFPGARSIDAFWRNIRNGVESISRFRVDELEPSFPDDMAARDDASYVPARGILDGVDLFDAGFFGMNPKEAEVLDPQQRVFLECAWESLEAAGYDPAKFSGAIGVFAGSSNNYYLPNHLYGSADAKAILGWLVTMMGNEKDYLTTRVAYKLDLKGPALNIQTACSTSLVAVCTAVSALTSYQCDMALAGGVSVTLPQKRGYLHTEGSILSPDGHCRAFDEGAKGTVFGNGCGIVVLKRLGDAIAAGDTIHAVVKGAALNNDGSSKVSFTAPSVDGHAEVIATAQALGGIDPATIGYVECHGTGTELGDPIEIAGLTQAFREGGAVGTGFCAIGSVKTNIGHLDAAAGVTGLIKAVLAVREGEIPPSLHFTKPNPKLGLEESPFVVASGLRPWPTGGGPRRAGVSSFGVGGTNAHVVLEEAPPARPSPARDEQLLLLSARSADALDRAAGDLRDFLEERPDSELADVAWTLQTGRRRFGHRLAIACRDRAGALQLLAKRDAKRTASAESDRLEGTVAFLLPGQGAQYVAMGRRLYEAEPLYRREVDECCEVLAPHMGLDLRDVLFPKGDAVEHAKESLTQTYVTQPALFVVEHALARLWMDWGVRPTAMIGHSLGEYVAATLSGVFSRDEALVLLAKRSRLMQDLPSGAMLAVRASVDAVEAILPANLSIASINAANLTVVSGGHDAAAAFAEILEAQGIAAKLLQTSHAFHSPMMDPIIEPFSAIVRATRRNAPSIPWISSLTGDWITAEEATDPRYWAMQLRRPVRFLEGARRLFDDPATVLLEVGPGTTLANLVRQHPDKPASQAVVSSLHPGNDPSADLEAMLLAAGRLWIAGAPPDWERVHGGPRRRVPLPTYPFERKRHWIDPLASAAAGMVEAGTIPVRPSEAEPVPADQAAAEPVVAGDRKTRLVARLRKLFADLSGIAEADLAPNATFLELGLDSLFLTQAGTTIHKVFGVKVSFRQLLEETDSLAGLAAHLDATLPAESETELRAASAVVATTPAASPTSAARGAGIPAPRAHAPAEAASFGPYKPIAKGPTGGLTPHQETRLGELVDRYTRRTAGSKRLTQDNRGTLADPRSVAGFRMLWKEIVYPIVTERSSGSKLWDIDGNEWIDMTNGFGMILFGHAPDFVTRAVGAQLAKGFEIGPQTPLAGEVAKRLTAMVGLERAAFCNTGSEAVTAAIRVARTVTGRDRIAMFAGAYHGIFDEVLVRPTVADGMLRATPIAPGIPPNMAESVLVLDYGDPASLDVLRAHGHTIAAVLVEPVQSRRPELQPRAFLKELREVTRATGSALVFDEVVTGFRTHPGGAQAIFDVRADLATYGKVLGGGLPIGVVAGSPDYMDALDGGAWRFGDASFPEVGVTFFAGTFVRHPLALAAAAAVLDHLAERGPELQRDLNLRTTHFVERLNAEARRAGAPVVITHFSSWFMLNFPHDVPQASLFYVFMRDKGIHLWEGRPAFLTTAHSDEDLDRVVAAFREALAEMQEAGFLPGDARTPPVPGARLGKDRSGKDAWFVPDPARPGKYLQVED